MVDNTKIGLIGGAGAIITAFLGDAIIEIIPWLIVMLMVVLCDLAFGIQAAWKMNERIRFSKGVRDTMGKLVVYTAFVLMVCFIDVATGASYHIERWACLVVCFIEGCSIFNHLLKPKGINIDLGRAISAVVAKLTGIDKKAIDEAIDKAEEMKDGAAKEKTAADEKNGRKTNNNQDKE